MLPFKARWLQLSHKIIYLLRESRRKVSHDLQLLSLIQRLKYVYHSQARPISYTLLVADYYPRCACAARVTVLGLCVCLCVCYSTSHFYVDIRATNDTNLLRGGWRSKILSDFLWKCFVAKLELFLLVRLHDKSAIFLLCGKRAYVWIWTRG